MRLIFIILFLAIMAPAYSQNTISYLYKGKINGKMPITMFIYSAENGCTGKLNFHGMYKYDNVSNWLQLDITQNDKEQFVLTEYNFTGVLILLKSKDTFNGIWISPDSKRQLKVELKQENLSEKDKKMYEDKFEKINYENYDC